MRNTAKPEPAEMLPYHGWRVPPMGAGGDAWDDELAVPTEYLPAMPDAAGRRRGRGRGRAGRDEIVFRPFTAEVAWGVTAAWAFVALSFFSTGPAFGFSGLFAVAGLLTGATTAVLLRARLLDTVGERSAWIATAAGMILLSLDLWRPAIPAYEAHFRMKFDARLYTMADAAVLELTHESLETVAMAAALGHMIIGRDIIQVGRNGVNRSLDGGHTHFHLSTLAAEPDIQTDIDREYIVYSEVTLPSDPYARDRRAKPCVFITRDHVVVASIGPDGTWQINPYRPVSRLSEDPAAELSPYQYRPGSPSDEGDIIAVYRLDHWGSAPELRAQALARLQAGG